MGRKPKRNWHELVLVAASVYCLALDAAAEMRGQSWGTIAANDINAVRGARRLDQVHSNQG